MILSESDGQEVFWPWWTDWKNSEHQQLARRAHGGGVIENASAIHICNMTFIGSFSSLRQATEVNVWWSANYQTFVLLNPQANVAQLESKTNDLVKSAGRWVDKPQRLHCLQLDQTYRFALCAAKPMARWKPWAALYMCICSAALDCWCCWLLASIT